MKRLIIEYGLLSALAATVAVLAIIASLGIRTPTNWPDANDTYPIPNASEFPALTPTDLANIDAQFQAIDAGFENIVAFPAFVEAYDDHEVYQPVRYGILTKNGKRVGVYGEKPFPDLLMLPDNIPVIVCGNRIEYEEDLDVQGYMISLIDGDDVPHNALPIIRGDGPARYYAPGGASTSCESG